MNKRIMMSAVLSLSLVVASSFAATPKRVIFVQNSGAAASQASDPLIINALGATGVTVGATNIPSLGDEVVAVQHGAEQDTYTPAEADLIFISESVTSGTPKNHMDDAVPMVVTENAFVHGDSSKPNAMYFATAAPSGITLLALSIIDTNHPITELFNFGNLTTWQDTPNVTCNFVESPLGSGISGLVQADATNRYSLLVIDQGGTGLLNPPADSYYQTMPARRAYLGMQRFENATVEGFYLMQRTVQWAIGDTVNAGGVPPSGILDWNGLE